METKGVGYSYLGAKQLCKLLKSIYNAFGHKVDIVYVAQSMLKKVCSNYVVGVDTRRLLFLGKQSVSFKRSHRGKGKDALIGLLTAQKQRDRRDLFVSHLVFDAVCECFKILRNAVIHNIVVKLDHKSDCGGFAVSRDMELEISRAEVTVFYRAGILGHVHPPFLVPATKR
jgi:hypothetical protein